jgi:diguanylate cyclase (GGDEF)-like protein
MEFDAERFRNFFSRPVRVWMRVPLSVVLGLSFLVVIGIGAIDPIFFGYSFSFFYLIPILSVTLRAGFRWGFLMSFLSAGAWYGGRLWAVSEADPLASLWNAVVQLAFFSLIAGIARSHQLASESVRCERELSSTDPLTGLANRRALMSFAEYELRRSRRLHEPLTVALLDMDDFKAVNDSRGHAVGDNFLRRVAHTLRTQLRERDMAARLGGDEFVLLLPNTDEDMARELMGQLLPKLEEVGDHPSGGPLGFSAGVVTFLSPVQHTDDLLRWADQVMYSAKHGGKRSVNYAVWPTPDNSFSI